MDGWPEKQCEMLVTISNSRYMGLKHSVSGRLACTMKNHIEV